MFSRPLLLLAMFLPLASAHGRTLRAAPRAADIEAVETTRILAPVTEYTRDGRAYVEFAPTIETRAAACTPSEGGAWLCTFETRVRDFFESEFGPWQPRRERLAWRKGCWVRAAED
jgi:hypothetical protein